MTRIGRISADFDPRKSAQSAFYFNRPNRGNNGTERSTADAVRADQRGFDPRKSAQSASSAFYFSRPNRGSSGHGAIGCIGATGCSSGSGAGSGIGIGSGPGIMLTKTCTVWLVLPPNSESTRSS